MNKFSETLLNNRQKINIAFIIFFVLFLYGNRENIYSWLYDHKLVPIAETFTELYFEDHTNLPNKIEKGKDTSFAFVIHNLEGKEMEYEYQIAYKNNEGDETKPFFKELLKEKVVVNNNDSVTVPVKVSLEKESKTGVVYVDILNKDQSIHFLIN